MISCEIDDLAILSCQEAKERGIEGGVLKRERARDLEEEISCKRKRENDRWRERGCRREKERKIQRGILYIKRVIMRGREIENANARR